MNRVQQMPTNGALQVVVPSGFKVKSSNWAPTGLPEKVAGKSALVVLDKALANATVRAANVNGAVTNH